MTRRDNKSECLVYAFTCQSCPVQAEGTVDGKPMYFRARGEHWWLGIGGDPLAAPEWSRRQPYGDGPFAAGWMELDEAREFIRQGVEAYRKGEPG